MTATAEQVKRLRRMVAESDTTTYTDADLTDYIESHPVLDALGNPPTITNDDGDGVMTNPDWTATYDLNAAAADVWTEKAASLAGNYDFSAGSQSFQRSGAWRQAMTQAKYYLSRRAPTTVTLHPYPKPDTDTTVN